MDVTVRGAGDVVVLALTGKLDAETTPAAQKRVNELIPGANRKVLMDFGKLDYISSAGLRLLLATARQQKAGGGGFRVCGLNPVVRQVFDISGFTEILNVFGTETDALKEF